MTTTPTAALVEEAEALSRCATPAPWIYTRGVCLKHYVASENKDLALSFQSMHWEDGREVAAEADAKFIARARTLVPELASALRRAEAERDEARAQVWGLICAGSNMAERKQHFRGLWETALEAGLKLERSVSELTATRDLLTAENARLQARVATLELLRRGGK